MIKKRPPVQCRVCKEKIYRDDQDDWIMPSTNYFYHKKCHEEWVEKKSDLHARASDDEWYEALIYYLAQVLKMPIHYGKLRSQWQHYLTQKKTAKGVYFAVRYFYDVLRGDINKAQGGIGIVGSIYGDSCAYWYKREDRETGICARIEEQIKQQIEQEQIVLQQTKRRTVRNKVISLDAIEEMED